MRVWVYECVCGCGVWCVVAPHPTQSKDVPIFTPKKERTNKLILSQYSISLSFSIYTGIQIGILLHLTKSSTLDDSNRKRVTSNGYNP